LREEMQQSESNAGCATYEEAIQFLFEFVDYEKITSQKYSIADFDLGRVERLLASVGSPHTRMNVVHVAGTKGKGSTAIMMQSAMTAAGLRTGLFTSPHLVDLEERVTINGQPIAKDEMRQALSTLRPYVDNIRERSPESSPTFFELITAAALVQFDRKAVDAAVIEVGLGGRLDSTNVVAPKVSVITRIGLDHTRQLGNTIAQVAAEKAGIIKESIPVVSSAQEPDALRIIEQTCAEKNSRLILVGRDVKPENIGWESDAENIHYTFDVQGLRRKYQGLRLPLIGEHQVGNAATALAALELLEEIGLLEELETAVRRGFADVRCPARLELFAGTPPVILDSAHNVASARALASALRRHFPSKGIIFVIGIAGDKDVAGILRAVLPLGKAAVYTKSESPRAMDPKALRDISLELSPIEAIATDNAQEAFEKALSLADADGLICITGSFYLAGLLRPRLVQEAA